MVIERLYSLLTGRPVLKMSIQSQVSKDSQDPQVQIQNDKIFQKIRRHRHNGLKFGYTKKRDEGYFECPFQIIGYYQHISMKDNTSYEYILVRKFFKRQSLVSDYDLHKLK